MPSKKPNFFETISAAINDVIDHGFDSQKRIDDWIFQIRKSAHATLVPEVIVQQSVAAALSQIYQRQIQQDHILEFHPGVSRFQLQMVKPKLRNELDRRIMANASLIKLNREAAIERTIQRFAGWSTSIPAGGSRAVDKKEVKDSIRKSMSQLPFEERRVAIDQGMKFISSLNNIIAVDRGALAGVWHSKWRRPGYNFRVEHKERDLHVYAVRDNWALNQGLMKVGPDGYTDQITMPGEEVYCTCAYRYVYSFNELPDNMITEKGRKALERFAIS